MTMIEISIVYFALLFFLSGIAVGVILALIVGFLNEMD